MLARLQFVAIVCLLSAQSAFAVTYGQALDIVRTLPPEAYTAADHGKLCEKIGVLKAQQLFPGSKVYNGISYKDHNRTIGELDLVVEEGGVATHVIEVKCWRNYSNAAHKADDQLERFSRYAGRCDIDFSLAPDEPGPKEISCELFANPNIVFGKMSYEDATAAGFDLSFDLTRAQVLSLIESLQN